ncbi:MAG: right-handed parallel beta-helix repeat-containing protein [Methylocella sp.]
MPTKITSSSNKITSLPAIAGALLACGLSAAPAQAIVGSRTAVSPNGTDSGNCAIATPCKTFAFAITQTAAGGEIDMLDPAGYGPVTITKAVSILNGGVGVGGIQVSSGNGITINAGPNDSVRLVGLTIDGLGTGTNGIQFNTGGNLDIENCVIRDFTGTGLNIAPSTSSIFTVSNTIAVNNFIGINVAPSGSAAGVLRQVTTNANNNGILASGTLTITVNDSLSFANNFGIESNSATTTVYLSRSTVTGNGTGVFNNGGTIFTFVNNVISANTTANVSGTLTPVKAQ